MTRVLTTSGGGDGGHASRVTRPGGKEIMRGPSGPALTRGPLIAAATGPGVPVRPDVTTPWGTE
jgi:hypothetical protein